MNVLRNVISFPCFLHTGSDNANHLNMKGNPWEGIYNPLSRRGTWFRHRILNTVGDLVIYQLDTVAGKEAHLQEEEKQQMEGSGRRKGSLLLDFCSKRSTSAKNPSSLLIKPTGQNVIVYFSLWRRRRHDELALQLRNEAGAVVHLETVFASPPSRVFFGRHVYDGHDVPHLDPAEREKPSQS